MTEDVRLLHEQMLKQNAGDIKELQKEIYGIPQRMVELEKRVGELIQSFTTFNTTTQDFLRRFEDKYQTKEMCSMCSESVNALIADYKEKNDKRVATLENKFERVIIYIVLLLVATLGFLGKYGFDVIIQTILKSSNGG